MLIPTMGGWILGPIHENFGNAHVDALLGKRLREAWVKAQLLVDSE